MKVLCVHPGPLMYTKVFLRLEPLGLELVAAASRRAGHAVRLIDLQAEPLRRFDRLVGDWKPDAVAIAGNYLANVPEIVDLAKRAKALDARAFVFVGGHSVSFIAEDILAHGEGAIDCVLKGEGEAAVPLLLDAIAAGSRLNDVPGAVFAGGQGRPPVFCESLDDLLPARDLLRQRRRYFLGRMDPCASIEFSRGCPWDCSFCSAWTFYGRSYRVKSPEVAAEEVAAIREPGLFIVDDVAFVRAEHGLAIGEAIARRGVRKRYYLETRADVLLRNKEVFRLWRDLGLEFVFIGIEAIDSEGLTRFRKRVPLGQNFEALEFARSLGVNVAINIIAEPDWDEERFRVVREWCLQIPEIVNISVSTPYPGTELWHTQTQALTTRDYRLFDIQHAVLPTRLPLATFYRELVATQRVLAMKHLGWPIVRQLSWQIAGLLLRGQTNFVRSLWSFERVFDAEAMLADHARPVAYAIGRPPAADRPFGRDALYVHAPRGRAGRALDEATERFVDAGHAGPSTGAGRR
ncbi:MAG: hopanoid C-3 methylase HpnR [Rhodospirillales bacterium]